MENEKKEGWLGKLFGSKKSSCCSIRIEEVKDDKKKDNKDEEQQQPACGCDSCAPVEIKKD